LGATDPADQLKKTLLRRARNSTKNRGQEEQGYATEDYNKITTRRNLKQNVLTNKGRGVFLRIKGGNGEVDSTQQKTCDGEKNLKPGGIKR